MVERAGVRSSGGGGIGWDMGVVCEVSMGIRESGKRSTWKTLPRTVTCMIPDGEWSIRSGLAAALFIVSMTILGTLPDRNC